MPDVLRSATRVRTAASLVLLVVVGTSCGRSTLDGSSAAEQILAQLRVAGGPAIATVDCPPDVAVDAGATFTCTATEQGGATWTIEVTQIDGKGTLDYQIAPG